MLKAVIFDFNGIIVDDEPLHLELFRRVLGEESIALTDEDYHAKYLGYDDRGCFTAALNDAGRAELASDVMFVAELIKRKANYYYEAIEGRFLLFPGAADLVKTLAANYPLAIASGALRGEIEVVLQRGGIRECFKEIIASEDVTICKPDPEGYNKALAALNALGVDQIHPNECLVIEDSVAGVEAAKRAGMWCLAVTNSYKADELAKADWIVSSLVNCDPEKLFGEKSENPV
ncbi:MAG: HAD family phosphatase [Acidobacteria bacterium]|nr:HAD family phosphatase [Acidobacteriota bacterium]